jgi:hypothetical protein
MKKNYILVKDITTEVGDQEEIQKYKTNRHERRAEVAWERGTMDRLRKQAIKDNITEGKKIKQERIKKQQAKKQ